MDLSTQTGAAAAAPSAPLPQPGASPSATPQVAPAKPVAPLTCPPASPPHVHSRERYAPASRNARIPGLVDLGHAILALAAPPIYPEGFGPDGTLPGGLPLPSPPRLRHWRPRRRSPPQGRSGRRPRPAAAPRRRGSLPWLGRALLACAPRRSQLTNRLPPSPPLRRRPHRRDEATGSGAAHLARAPPGGTVLFPGRHPLPCARPPAGFFDTTGAGQSFFPATSLTLTNSRAAAAGGTPLRRVRPFRSSAVACGRLPAYTPQQPSPRPFSRRRRSPLRVSAQAPRRRCSTPSQHTPKGPSPLARARPAICDAPHAQALSATPGRGIHPGALASAPGYASAPAFAPGAISFFLEAFLAGEGTRLPSAPRPRSAAARSRAKSRRLSRRATSQRFSCATRHPTDGSCGASSLRAVTSLLPLRPSVSPRGATTRGVAGIGGRRDLVPKLLPRSAYTLTIPIVDRKGDPFFAKIHPMHARPSACTGPQLTHWATSGGALRPTILSI
jgi:hypothetical protein